MYQKLNQNKKFKVFLASLAVFMMLGFIVALPFEEVAAANTLGTFFGGRIVSFVPGYPWVVGVPPAATYGYCPAHVIIISYGAPYRGPLGLTLPPLISKGWYNYVTPGVAVKGAYYPIPLVYPSPYSCPYEAAIPLFQTSLMGSGAVPAK